jgi:hypothetical protein
MGALSMQEMAGGDNNRTPVIFQVPDIYRFIGDTKVICRPKLLQICQLNKETSKLLRGLLVKD